MAPEQHDPAATRSRAFPSPAETLPSPPRQEGAQVRHHGRFQLLAVTAEVEPAGREKQILQVALDVAPDQALLAG